VSPAGPVISSIVPPVLHLDTVANVSVQVNGSGFQTGQALTCAPVCNIISETINTAQLGLDLSFDAQHYSPGWIDLTVTDPAGHVSNVGKLAFLGNQNTLTMNATGELYQLDQAQGGPITHNGLVWEFRPDGTPVRNFLVGELRNGIAADNATGFVVIDGNIYDPAALTILNGQAVPHNNFTAGSAVSSANGASCSLQVALGDISCVGSLTAVPLTTATAPAGNQPWSVSMVPFGLELDALVYARDGLTLDRISVPDMTLKGSLTLTGFTPASLLATTNGGWHVVTFGSGIAAGNAAVLSAADAALSIVDLTTMAESHRIALPGAPFRIAPDATHGAVIVAFSDVAAGVTRYASVDVATGTLKTLTSTSTQLSVGFGVSADGTKLYSCSRGTCEVLLNN
jgi:hypothetical protein